MNRNQLKLLACVSMLADHIGYWFFPQIILLRYVGRLAMPLFAFFIGEGCFYTSNRKKYFLTVFLLGSACQLCYLAEDIFSNGSLTIKSDSLFLNFLISFSLAIIGCFLVLDTKKALVEKNGKAAFYVVTATAFTVTVVTACCVLYYFNSTAGIGLQLDYGFFGVVLPMSAVLFKEKRSKLSAFSVCLLLYCIFSFKDTPYVWFALLTLPLLFLYNGKRGSEKFKYFFYVFYPAHLAMIYLIDMLI